MTARDAKQSAPAVRPSLRDPAFAPAAWDAGEPVFAEPWQAQAFAVAIKLSDAGWFTWVEWAAALAEEIKAADAADAKAGRPPDDGTRYYEHWLSALEKLVAAKGLAEEEAIQVRKEEWAEAYRHTPHGQPVELRVGQEARRRKAASRE